MSTRYAMIEAGAVINVCLWDGVSPWEPPAGLDVVPCPEHVGVGWMYYDGNWISPGPSLPAPPPPQREFSYHEFFRDLHNAAEQDRYLDLEDALSKGPLTPPLRAFRRFRAIAQSAPTIRLDHDDTIAGVALLKALGVYGEEPGATQRASQVLRGERPAE